MNFDARFSSYPRIVDRSSQDEVNSFVCAIASKRSSFVSFVK